METKKILHHLPKAFDGHLLGLLLLTISHLLPPQGLAQSVQHPLITEFLASNRENLRDDQGATSDWIEIWNPGPIPFGTEGLFLTDDPERPAKWAFPNRSIPADGYLLVFASGRDFEGVDGTLHANFRVTASEGGFLALTRETDNRFEALSVFEAYPEQKPDISFGLSAGASSQVVYFPQPTPGRPNRPSTLQGFVADTEFSIDRGFYAEPITVTVSSATPGATLVYTVDGSLPSTRNGTQIRPSSEEAPTSHDIQIADTTTLRVMAFRPGFEPTNVDTQTYIFPDKVLQQDAEFHAIGDGVRWGHAGPDWEMDPDITEHPNPEIRPQPTDLLQIPTVSLGMSFDEMFGRNGIYIAGQSVERETSIEYLRPNLDPNSKVTNVGGFQTDGTVQIVGGSSPNRWKSDKLSLRLKFERDLEYPVFGRDAVDRFDTLVLDARLNNVWHYGGGVEPTGQRNRAQYVRDQYTANLHNLMGGTSPHGHHVHLYLNGIYWGIHTLHERPDDNFAASYLGGENEDYDSIKHRPNDVLQGSSENYLHLHSLANQVRGSSSVISSIQEILDIPDFTDYMLVNYYVANTDWAHHNWYASFNREAPNGRWRFHSWDAEKGLHRVMDDRTNRNDEGGPTNLHHDLAHNPEYRLQFADRAYQALRYGPLSPDAARQTYFEISETINLPIRVESARWGDNQRSTPYDRLDWIATRNQLFGESRQTSHELHDYFTRRSDIVLDQFRRRGWLPSLEPPVFNQHGGLVETGFITTIESSESGTIYYTINGEDPRIPGTSGEQTSTPLIQAGARKKALMPQDDRSSATWMLPEFDDSDWPEGRRGAGYENGNGYQAFLDSNLNFGDLVSSSTHETIYMRVEFNVSDPSIFDGMTLKMRYDDGFVAYLNGSEIARANSRGNAGTRQAWNASASTTHSDNEATSFVPFDVSDAVPLLNAGRNVLAIHGLNTGQSSSDFLIWPTLDAFESSGGSPSGIHPSATRYLGGVRIQEPVLVKARIKSGSNWSPLLQASFHPNTDGPSPQNLTISKIHYHPAPLSSAEREAGIQDREDFEFLELKNLSDQHLDLSGASFSDGIRFGFAQSLPQLPPRGTIVIAAAPKAFSLRSQSDTQVYGPFRFGSRLANNGERLTLIDEAGSTIFSVRYDDSSPWPEQVDGSGFALSLQSPQTGIDLNDPEQWVAVPQDPSALESSGSQMFQAWLDVHFSPAELANSTISGHHADPDEDGISNLREYFFGTSPRERNPRVPDLQMVANEPSQDGFIDLQFTRVHPIAPDLWHLEMSPDLLHWESIQANGTEHASTSSTRTIRMRVSPALEKAFFRLVITPPTD